VGAREWALARFPRASEHVLSNAARGLVCGRSLLAVAASPRLRLDVYVAANAHAMGDGNYLTTWSGVGGASALVDAFEALVSLMDGGARERGWVGRTSHCSCLRAVRAVRKKPHTPFCVL
jgi:hypothetical protein